MTVHHQINLSLSTSDQDMLAHVMTQMHQNAANHASAAQELRRLASEHGQHTTSVANMMGQFMEQGRQMSQNQMALMIEKITMEAVNAHKRREEAAVNFLHSMHRNLREINRALGQTFESQAGQAAALQQLGQKLQDIHQSQEELRRQREERKQAARAAAETEGADKRK